VISAPTEPTIIGHNFAGWYNETLTTIHVFATILGNNLTLYAKWDVNLYSISFETNGGSTVSAITQNYLSNVTEPASPSKTGFVFGNWCSDAALTTDYLFTIMPYSNITLYVKWLTVISFESNGGDPVEPMAALVGTAITAPEIAKVGNTFAGWFTDLELTVSYLFTVMPAEPLTLYAKWAINQYTISFETNEGSLITPMTQDYGSEVLQPVADPTRPGYVFSGWFEDPEFVFPYQFISMPAQNITVYADWTPEQHTIYFSIGAGGANVMPITQETDTLVNAPADPES